MLIKSFIAIAYYICLYSYISYCYGAYTLLCYYRRKNNTRAKRKKIELWTNERTRIFKKSTTPTKPQLRVKLDRDNNIHR